MTEYRPDGLGKKERKTERKARMREKDPAGTLMALAVHSAAPHRLRVVHRSPNIHSAAPLPRLIHSNP